MTDKNTKQRSNVSTWLRIVSYILVGIIVVLDYFSLLAEGYLPGAETLGRVFIVFIAGLVGIACGNKCSKWAIEIKKSPNVAYAFGFLFILLGLLIYWTYYRIKKYW